MAIGKNENEKIYFKYFQIKMLKSAILQINFPKCPHNFPPRRLCSSSSSVVLPSTNKNSGFTDYSHKVVRTLQQYVPGKSTLSDRLLQLTGVISDEADNQYLDKLEVERRRGITVKAQTCTMFYKGYMLNLIDTPGHVDFNFEVRRSLATCDGAILLVAANQGVQAQTLFNFHAAFEQNLTIIPAINKIDMTGVDVANVEKQLKNAFTFSRDEMLRISAKSGQNVPDILEAIIQRIPPPKVEEEGPCQAHIFDSCFDASNGALLFVVIRKGVLRKDLPIRFFSSPEKEYIVTEVGILHPEIVESDALYAGQMGYLYCGVRSSRDVLVGDTLFHSGIPATEVKPYLEIGMVKPTVYSGLFPATTGEYETLRNAVESLQLNDPSVVLQSDSSTVFGHGWRVGFVGNLHMEVFGQRLEQEYGELAVFTTPSVEYLADIVDNETIRKKRHKGRAQIVISKPGDYPEVPQDIERFLEPMSLVSIMTPKEHFQRIENLCRNARGESVETSYIDETRMLLKWRLPLSEIIVDFFDSLRRLTSGYASFEQKDDGHNQCGLEKICIYVNDRQVDELSMLCPGVNARARGNAIVKKLQEKIPRQQYEVVIKATLGKATKAIASAKIKPMKKDFTQTLKGNFVASRLGKKLKHQAEGKEKMKMVGVVKIPREAFLNVVKNN